MANITLGQVATAVAFLVALFTGLAYLSKQLKSWLESALKNEFKTINDKIDNLDKKIGNVDMESCKNYLVQYLADIDKGVYMDEISKERFWEEYAHYQKIGGNSYIKRKVETMEKDGKL